MVLYVELIIFSTNFMGLGLGVHEIELTDVADILLCRDVDDIHDMMDDIE